MKIVTLTKEEFDEYSKKHRYNSFYQTSNYANFKEMQEHFKSHYLGFKDNNNNLVGASLFLYKSIV